MRKRLIIAVVLAALGAGLASVAIARNGLPWEFGARAGVVLEVSGEARLRASKARMERDLLENRSIPLTVDADVYPGDEVRVGPLGFARVSLREGVAGFDTHASGTFRVGMLELSRGRVDLELYKPLQVRLEGDATGEVTQLTAGRFWLSAGGGGFAVHVIEGTASRGEVAVTPGKALLVMKGKARELDPEGVPKPDTLTLTREEDLLRGQLPPLSQLFINGRAIAYPDESGELSTKLPATAEDPVFVVRDIFGRSAILTPQPGAK